VALVADARPHRVLSLGRENVGDFAAVSRDLRPNTGGYSGTRSIDGYDGGLVIDRQWAKAMTALTGRADFDPLRMVKGNVAGPFDPRLWDELDTTRVVASHQLSDSEVRTLLPAGSAPIAAGQDLTVWSTPSLGPVFTADGRVPVGLTLRRDPEDPGRLVVDVPNSEARQPIVVSESMATGWTATVVSGVDRGEQLPLARHDGWLMSFTLPHGGGEVLLRYHQPGLAAGVWLTALGCLGTLALLIIGRSRDRRPHPPPARRGQR
jgi:hypothetical protein